MTLPKPNSGRLVVRLHAGHEFINTSASLLEALFLSFAVEIGEPLFDGSFVHGGTVPLHCVNCLAYGGAHRRVA